MLAQYRLQENGLLRAPDELNLVHFGQNNQFKAAGAGGWMPRSRRVSHEKKIMKQVVTGLFLVFTLTRVVVGEPQPSQIQGIDRNGSDCIWIRTVRDYTTLDDQNLLIRGSGKRSFLVTLSYPSFELRSSVGLGFSSRDDQLCPYGGDGIILGGLSRESVRIRSITEVNADQADELMVHFGKKEPIEQETAAPEKVKGAEVEELD